MHPSVYNVIVSCSYRYNNFETQSRRNCYEQIDEYMMYSPK